MTRLNYFQPVYLDYQEKLIKNITGYVMSFPNLDKFNLHYDGPKKNSPTNSLLDILRLLLPQIRVINKNLMVDGQPNPAAFFADQAIPAEILALIFKKWVEVCYPESEHKALLPLCENSQFHWNKATPEHLEYWAPSWAIALELQKHKYQLGNHSFKFLFGPGSRTNTVELVSWPPFSSPRDYRASIAVIISTQSDIDSKKINLHFQMKRWFVKRGDSSEVGLQKNTTRCYVRRLSSWFGDYSLLEPNAFTILEANYRFDNGKYIPQWKNQRVIKILERLSVEIPDIANLLANPTNFIETNQMDILIPARSYQKAGWGTGVAFSDERNLLEQILDFLPSEATLTAPWLKIPVVGNINKSIKQRFQKTPTIAKPSKGELPPKKDKKDPKKNKEKELEFIELQTFLTERANNLTLRVCYRTEEVREAIERIAKHYFGNSLTLDFQSSQGLADPIKSKNDKKMVPNTKHLKEFGKQNQPEFPAPIIVEILPPNHPSYSQGQDPYPHIKSILPKYNLIPQCILSSETVKKSDEFEEVESEEELEKNIDNRALSAIIDAILPFNQDYPLSIFEGELCKDNTVYAGFYVIKRNKKTANQSFHEPVLVAIYKNQVSVLLPAIDLQFRSMSDAICELAKPQKPDSKKPAPNQVINNMLSTLSQEYCSADDIYLFAHAQNARSYWTWLQDSKFDPENPPSRKIHIIRIRDESYDEAPEGYGLSTEEETFEEKDASFGQGIFIPQDFKIEKDKFTQTVFSIALKSGTNQLPKQMSRFQPSVSKGYEIKTDKDGNPIIGEDGKPVRKKDSSGKSIPKDIYKNPSPTKGWKAPQTRAHNILATPSPENFKLHHAITHHLRTCHWWTEAQSKYPLPLSLAEKLKEWCFNDGESEDTD